MAIIAIFTKHENQKGYYISAKIALNNYALIDLNNGNLCRIFKRGFGKGFEPYQSLGEIIKEYNEKRPYVYSELRSFGDISEALKWLGKKL